MKDTTDFGYQEIPVSEKQKRVEQVFASVAEHYDVMNDCMSLGLHRWWKHYAVLACQIRPMHWVLDLACGSGDLALRIIPKIQEGHVILSDINEKMLALSADKCIDRGWVEKVSFVRTNAEALPFQTGTLDRIMIGFGLRNVTDKERALQEMARVLKPGGQAVILEFSHPTMPWLQKCYTLYSFQIIPWLGERIAKDRESYRYLVESIRRHPDQETLKGMILEAGFDACHYQNLTQGIVCVHKAIKY